MPTARAVRVPATLEPGSEREDTNVHYQNPGEPSYTAAVVETVAE